MAKDLQISERELAFVLEALAETENIPGDVVEFGCYTGDTSVRLAEQMKNWPEKWLPLHWVQSMPEKQHKSSCA